MKCKLMLLMLSAISLPPATADIAEDRGALLDFLGSMINHTRSLRRDVAVNWKDGNASICSNWTGITCDRAGSSVIAVRLPALRLGGRIPPDTLGRLSALQVLSLPSNGLSGPLPPDLLGLTNLTGLHLQLNGLSGALPSNLSSWRNLTVLDLSYNQFHGSIPASISGLARLAALNLSGNSFSGEIPDFGLPKLRFLNLSNNLLNGSVPGSLRRFPDSSFSGNGLVMPAAASVPPPPPPSPLLPPLIIQSSPSSSPFPIQAGGGKKLGESDILGIAAGGFAVVFVALAILTVVVWCGKKGRRATTSVPGKAPRSPENGASGGRRDGNGRLAFFEGCNFAFDLEDLLRASAEVLGKGTVGSAYKATLEDAGTVVVKRLKGVGVGKREFEQHMEAVGKVKHENVVELRAYYYSKEEKLIVYDFYSQGSVSALLHGKTGKDRNPLDWDTRLKIAIGAARGIACIHAENGGKLVHGNIKPSNVFLNAQSFGCISDLGLSSLSTHPLVPRVSRAAGYRAPEVVDSRRSTQASDVYSFGVLLLELLTGRSPIQVSGGGDEVVHLVRWVQSVVREEWTAEVFDVELMRYPNIDEELVEMLQIGMACVVRMPEQRPKMAEVVRLVEDVRRFDTGIRLSAEAITVESSTRAV